MGEDRAFISQCVCLGLSLLPVTVLPVLCIVFWTRVVVSHLIDFHLVAATENLSS